MAMKPADLAKEYEYLDDMLVGEIIESVVTEMPDDDSATHETAVRKLLGKKSAHIKSIVSPPTLDTPACNYVPPIIPMFGKTHIRGRKPVRRAVLIGINYVGTEFETLEQSVEDVFIFRNLLIHEYGWHHTEIHVLTDVHRRGLPSNGLPTEAKIFEAIDELVADLIQGDCLVFFYSGHGDQKRDQYARVITHYEYDGFDEYIVSSDGRWISDNQLSARLCWRVRAGATLTCVFDSCYSGTILDLNYHSQSTQSLLDPLRLTGTQLHYKVVCISACRDGTLSSDAPYYDGWPYKGGTLTTALAVVLTEHPISLTRVLERLLCIMRVNNRDQRPTLSSSYLISGDSKLRLNLDIAP